MPIGTIAAQTTVTSTGAVGSGLSISGISGDFTIHVRVQQLSAASGQPSATIQLEDSVNAFAAVIPQANVQVAGPISGTAAAQAGISESHFSWRKYQLPNLRAGTASAVIRPNVTVLGGTTPSLTLDAWIEY